MLDTIGAFGSGIGTNLLSDSLSKKLEAFKDKKAIASFTQSLRDWEIEFEKQNDGTIITNGAFYSHVKYHNVIENIVAYAQLSEEQFFEKYSWMLNKPDLLQFFGIVLAEDWEYELSDVFSSENAKNTYRVRNALADNFHAGTAPPYL